MRRIPSLGLVVAALLAPACTATGPERFDSPDLAVEALIGSLRANDVEKSKAILGAEADDVLASGDAIADQNNLAAFLAAYDEKHSLVDFGGPGARQLVVGSSDWPMPIPLIDDGGHWRFDTAAGIDELLSRRIGRNELDTVQVCLAIVDAQRDYALADPDHDGIGAYAERFISSPDKKDGLYWRTAEGEPQSPLGPLVADAAEEGYTSTKTPTGERQPFHGYFFKMLMQQGPSAEGGEFDYVVDGKMIGGFALVAWPAEYGKSGIMTFMVNHAGVVFEKDLGDETPTKAKQYTTFSPGAGWTKVE